MFDVLVLVCSIAATPNLGDCTAGTAVAALRLPEPEREAVTCAMHGQAYLAQTEIGRSLVKGEVVKVVCRRRLEVADDAKPTDAVALLTGK
jgi:hypothetical protein